MKKKALTISFSNVEVKRGQNRSKYCKHDIFSFFINASITSQHYQVVKIKCSPLFSKMETGWWVQNGSIKGTVSRDFFVSSFFFMNHLPPSPRK
jgi:hypothetical protein